MDIKDMEYSTVLFWVWNIQPNYKIVLFYNFYIFVINILNEITGKINIIEEIPQTSSEIHLKLIFSLTP